MNEVPAGAPERGHDRISREVALERARLLLRRGEAHVPASVNETITKLAARDVWHQISRNDEAYSCEDAARKRMRLGHKGIPIWDEMKSLIAECHRAGDGATCYAVAHCRGDHVIDLDRLGKALGAASVPRLVSTEDVRVGGMDKGLVSPFREWHGPRGVAGVMAVQVYDEDLLVPLGIPGTVMTNAGDRTWGVEVYPSEIARSLGGVLRAEVSVPDERIAARPPGLRERGTIGIITGNAPESGVTLWNHIAEEVRRCLGDRCAGDISMPPVAIKSLPELGMALELDARHEPVWTALSAAVVEACENRVRILSLACNASHYFTPRIRTICRGYDTQFVSMPEVLGEWLRTLGVEQVALLGLRYVSDVDTIWSAYGDPLRGIEVEVLRPGVSQRLEGLARRTRAIGVNRAGLGELREMVRKDVSANHVVLALTELSALVDLQRGTARPGKVLIDPLAVYGKALARQWLGVSEVSGASGAIASFDA
jgi:aspartate/glutamate racemase/prolyl-tRNA editing enzyme YbaK/EbsC (Cys-tRNA(Pro) deacylase)